MPEAALPAVDGANRLFASSELDDRFISAPPPLPVGLLSLHSNLIRGDAIVDVAQEDWIDILTIVDTTNSTHHTSQHSTAERQQHSERQQITSVSGDVGYWYCVD